MKKKMLFSMKNFQIKHKHLPFNYIPNFRNRKRKEKNMIKV